MTNILDSWPIDSPPRPNQIKALNWLANQTAKYIILEAPVGSGKSLIGLTYSRFLNGGAGNSFLLTPQRILQEQYEHTFDATPACKHTINSLYGKSNYPCSSRNTTCDIGSLIKPRCPSCPYTAAVGRAKGTANVVLNYKLALLMFGYTEVFSNRQLMVLDECHTVEEHLTEFNALAVYAISSEKYGVKWKVQTSLKAAYNWVNETYKPNLLKYFQKQFDLCEPLLDKAGSELTAQEVKQLRDYNKLEDHVTDIEEFMCMDINHIEQFYVLVHDKDMMKFKQVTGAKNFRRMLDPMAGKFLFMSSTILDYKGFCNDLGIDPSTAAFVSIESDFPVENRPVTYMPQMKMNAAWNKPEQKGERKLMIKSLKQLLDLHHDESGIIHTGNFAIAKWLVEELQYAVPQQVLHHNPDSGDDRNSVIRQHQTVSKPTLLISPSITEGLDLYDDLSRFAIFVKIPFGFLGDQWIKKRLDMSAEWYRRRALIDIIQGGGRIVRSKDDWGSVYILDASWGYLHSNTKHMIPKWWNDAYQVL